LLPPDVKLKLKYTTINFGWGSAQTPLGELTTLPASPRPSSWNKGAYTTKKIEEEGKGKGY